MEATRERETAAAPAAPWAGVETDGDRVTRHPELIRLLALLPADEALNRHWRAAEQAREERETLERHLPELLAGRQAASEAAGQDDAAALAWARCSAEAEAAPPRLGAAVRQSILASLEFLAAVRGAAQAEARRIYAETAAPAKELREGVKTLDRHSGGLPWSPLPEEVEKQVRANVQARGQEVGPKREAAARLEELARLADAMAANRFGVRVTDSPPRWQAAADKRALDVQAAARRRVLGELKIAEGMGLRI